MVSIFLSFPSAAAVHWVESHALSVAGDKNVELKKLCFKY